MTFEIISIDEFEHRVETWRDVPGHEDTHEVSNKGRVRSKERLIRFLNRSGEECWRCKKAHMLTPTGNGRGYLIVPFGRAAPKNRYIHRLVCEAFNGPPPFEGAEVNHKDGIKANNVPENLEWCDRSHNNRHRYELKRKAAAQ